MIGSPFILINLEFRKKTEKFLQIAKKKYRSFKKTTGLSKSELLGQMFFTRIRHKRKRREKHYEKGKFIKALQMF